MNVGHEPPRSSSADSDPAGLEPNEGVDSASSQVTHSESPEGAAQPGKLGRDLVDGNWVDRNVAAGEGSAEPRSLLKASVEHATRLIEDFQTGVWRYLRALGCDAAMAEDLTQETFVAVLQRPFVDHGPLATSAYLRRVAHNLYVTHRRRHGRVVTTDEVEEISQTWERWAGQDQGEELIEALNDCLTRLSDRARRALEMRFRGEQSRNAIAEFLSITEHGAKNLMQRAKHQLRECIERKLKRP